jgi:hypothetical protein
MEAALRVIVEFLVGFDVFCYTDPRGLSDKDEESCKIMIPELRKHYDPSVQNACYLCFSTFNGGISVIKLLFCHY